MIRISNKRVNSQEIDDLSRREEMPSPLLRNNNNTIMIISNNNNWVVEEISCVVSSRCE